MNLNLRTTSLTAPIPALVLGILITLICLTFIENHAIWYSGVAFWDIINYDDRPMSWVLLVILISLVALFQRLPRWIEYLPDWIGGHPLRIALGTTTTLAILALVAYHNFPLSMDEYAPWFQAKIFAAGTLTGRFPPELIDHLISTPYQGHFFAVDRQTGAVISTYWPGFALLLTPFMVLGTPWLCNPLIVGATLMMIWKLTLDITQDCRTAGWAMLFTLASPAVTLNGISYYSMSAHLLTSAIFVWLLLDPTPRRCFTAGLVGAFALSLHNPYPHLVFMLPWVVWIVARKGVFRLLPLSAGYLVLGTPLVLMWTKFRADLLSATMRFMSPPITAPHAETQGTLDAVFDILAGLFSSPSPEMLLARSGGLLKIWLWASPLLLVLAIAGLRYSRHVVMRYLMASAISTLLAYYLIRFDQGMGWGYRYFHPAFLALPVLAAVAVRHLEMKTDASRQWPALAVTLALCGLSIMTPGYALLMERRVSSAIHDMPPAIANRSLKILSGRGYCATVRCDLLHNDPWLRGDVVLIDKKQQMTQEDIGRLFPGVRKVATNPYGTTYRLPEDK